MTLYYRYRSGTGGGIDIDLESIISAQRDSMSEAEKRLIRELGPTDAYSGIGKGLETHSKTNKRFKRKVNL